MTYVWHRRSGKPNDLENDLYMVFDDPDYWVMRLGLNKDARRGRSRLNETESQ